MKKPRFKTWYNGKTKEHVLAEMQKNGKYLIVETRVEPFDIEPDPVRQDQKDLYIYENKDPDKTGSDPAAPKEDMEKSSPENKNENPYSLF